MRFLKKLLVGIYVFLGGFTVACFVAWCVVGSEPAALIAGAFAGAGLESVVAGMMKLHEIKSAAREKGGGKNERGQP